MRAQRVTQHVAVVEGDDDTVLLLTLFVTLARDNNYVTRTSSVDSVVDRTSTIGFDRNFACARRSASTRQHRVENGERIFRSRVVIREHGNVRAGCGSRAHQRPLGSVAVTATAQHDDDAPADCQLTGLREQL